MDPYNWVQDQLKHLNFIPVLALTLHYHGSGPTEWKGAQYVKDNLAKKHSIYCQLQVNEGKYN